MTHTSLGFAPKEFLKQDIIITASSPNKPFLHPI